MVKVGACESLAYDELTASVSSIVATRGGNTFAFIKCSFMYFVYMYFRTVKSKK